MKRYEYKTDRRQVAISEIDEKGEWLLEFINFEGKEGWRLHTYNTQVYRPPNARGELDGQMLVSIIYERENVQ